MRTVLTIAAWLIAGAALAQPASAPPAAAAPADKPAPTVVPGVVVEGKAPMTVQAFAKAVGAFVQEQDRPGPVGQIARWRAPICPMAAGLAADYNAFVAQRIRDVAAHVGAPDGECTGVNVLVVFTAKPDVVMADVRDHRPWLLGYHFYSETKSLAAFEPPMKSWYVTATNIGLITSAFVGPGTAVDAPGPLMTELQTGIPNTHIQVPLKSQFAFALVVVDSNRLVGHAIGPVADQVAMVALSKPVRRAGCRPLPSVMDVLNPECPASAHLEGLTPYDEGFLQGLYAYESSEGMAFERAAIAKTIIAATGPTGLGSAPQADLPPAGIAERIKDDQPGPGTEAFVRRWAQSMAAGAPDYTGMAPGLAHAARSQQRGAIALFKSWGALRSIRFDSVTPDYQNRYIVTFDKADIPVMVSPIGKDGKVAALRFTPPASGQSSPPKDVR